MVWETKEPQLTCGFLCRVASSCVTSLGRWVGARTKEAVTLVVKVGRLNTSKDQRKDVAGEW